MSWKQKDGLVIDEGGKVIFFSADRFFSDIVQGDCCYLCGRSPQSVKFNREHILPDWLLSKFGLHRRSITLPNGVFFKYGEYVLPCCEDCNSLMGKRLENVVRPLFEGGYKTVVDYVSKNGPLIFYVWLCNIFLKTHLKDKTFRRVLDRRYGKEESIADDYDFGMLHHIHCIARSIYTGAIIDPTVLGSILFLPTKILPNVEPFDFVDLHEPKTMLIRINDTCIVTALDDSCCAQTFFKDIFLRFTGPLSALQVREVMGHLSYLNVNLKERPEHKSLFKNNEYRIISKIPETVQLNEDPAYPLQDFIYGVCSQMVSGHPNAEKLQKGMKDGKWTSLFDGEGKFIENSLELVPRKSE
jgi:hypothetical protein